MPLTIASKLSIDKLDLKGKRVLIRVDFNVPIDDRGHTTNDQRIKATLPTIKYVLNQDVDAVILMSHLGRPEGRPNSKYSLKPVAVALETLLDHPVKFLNDCVGPEVERECQQAHSGQVILLENLRFHIEEEGSAIQNDGQKIKADPYKVKEFRDSLARLGDVFVNDAFGTAHRAHSSVVGVCLNQRAVGFLMKKELDFFSKALNDPSRPFVAILGGAKVSDKILLIENLIDKVDALIIGGGMAYTFKKILFDVKIGSSLFDKNGANIVQKLADKARSKKVSLYFPVDHVIADKFDHKAKTALVSDEEGIPDGWLGMDIGPKSIKLFHSVINQAKTIIWNGPMGVFEMPSFESGTLEILKAIIDVTREKGALSIAGGGDTAAAVEKWNAQGLLSHMSTGGGASLELLEGKMQIAKLVLQSTTESFY